MNAKKMNPHSTQQPRIFATLNDDVMTWCKVNADQRRLKIGQFINQVLARAAGLMNSELPLFPTLESKPERRTKGRKT